MQNKNEQTVYIHMDDSGVFHLNENICVYGGIVFLNKDDQDNFTRKYRSTINQFKCKYCNGTKGKCRKRCPELKDTNLNSTDMRRIFNLLKKEFTYALVIENQKVKKDTMNNKSKRGKFRDYAQRRMIKQILVKLISLNKIDPNKPLKLIVRIDQQTTSTDSIRPFVEDITRELTKGIYNAKYDINFPPILFSDFDIELKYVVSHRHICIQASDIIAGETRKIIISGLMRIDLLKKLEYLNVKLFLP